MLYFYVEEKILKLCRQVMNREPLEVLSLVLPGTTQITSFASSWEEDRELWAY